MHEKQILEKLRRYEPETVLDIEWDRENGRLGRYYLFCGFDGNFPLLVAYEGVQKSPVFFNILDENLSIEKIEEAPIRLINSQTLIARILEAREQQILEAREQQTEPKP